jgi:hypothetical protein
MGEAVPLGKDGRSIVVVDVLQEFLLSQVFCRVPGEPFERRIDEPELPLHVVRDDAFAHGGGDGLQVALNFAVRALGPPPTPALTPQEGQEQDQQSEQRASCQEVGVGEL